MECKGVDWSWSYRFLILSNRFRWVYCQLEALRPCFPNNLRRMLDELPKSLDETYQRILKEINNANHKQAHQLLQCLAVALRPLQVEELAEVLALDVDAGGIPTFNAKWRWEDHEAAVLFACSSLVSVINDRDSRVVQFSHFSVKEFLTSDRLASMEDVSQFHISDEPSHLILAQACLGAYLSMHDRTSEDSVKDVALLPYSDKYFDQHARVGKVELRIEDALDCLFNLDEPHFEALIRRADAEDTFRHFRVPSDKDPKGVLTIAAPFFVAGQIGLRCLAERLIVSNQQQIIGLRVQGWTLLHLIVGFEDFDVGIAQLLLAHGADVNSHPDYATRTPPHIASLQSQSHVERLVDGTDEIENKSQISGSDLGSESSESFAERSDDSFDFDYDKKSGFTPLHIAVSKARLDMCQMLLKHKADVRAQDNKGNTPLHLAFYGGHLEISRILLEYNAEVNSQNEDGSTPLHIASSNGNIDLFRLLLAHNANAFAHDIRGNTPLHVAAIGGHIEVVRGLLELKADVDSLNGEGLTPSQRALEGGRKGYLDVVWLLLNHGADVKYVKVHEKSGNTLLHFAASEGHLEIARMLLERKADVDSLNGKGLTPLHRALLGQCERCLDIVRLLLDHGANVNVHDNDRNTPLHFAVSKGSLELARMLLEHKADVNALNEQGSTPLHRAFELWRGDIVWLLLNHGADARGHDKRGNTLLHVAAKEGDLELARVGIERNMDVNSQNNDGLTALLFALKRENVDVARLFLDHNADVHVRDERGNTPLHVAAFTGNGHLDICRILLERKAEVNSQNRYGSTPLLLASERGPELVQLFLDHNADLHARNGSGDTLLHRAAIAGRLEVVRLLLELNAEVNSRNNKGSTPLHLAFPGSPHAEGNLDIARLLLDHGADMQIRNLDGKTASQMACGSEQQEILQLLSPRATQ